MINKQSSMDWIKHALETYGDSQNLVITWEVFDELIEQAKAMHKEEIIESNRDGVDMVIEHKEFITGEEYYKRKWQFSHQ